MSVAPVGTTMTEDSLRRSIESSRNMLDEYRQAISANGHPSMTSASLTINAYFGDHGLPKRVEDGEFADITPPEMSGYTTIIVYRLPITREVGFGRSLEPSADFVAMSVDRLIEFVVNPEASLQVRIRNLSTLNEIVAATELLTR